MMSSVNFYSNYSQQQSAVAFRGKASVSKATLDSLNHYKKTVANMPERKGIFLFANIKSFISSWFRDLKIMLTNPKNFIEYNPFKNKKIDYSKAHSIDAGKKGAEFAANITKISTPQYNNKITSALMEFHETMAKKISKK